MTKARLAETRVRIRFRPTRRELSVTRASRSGLPVGKVRLLRRIGFLRQVTNPLTQPNRLRRRSLDLKKLHGWFPWITEQGYCDPAQLSIESAQRCGTSSGRFWRTTAVMRTIGDGGAF
jgi:hypothetical protein